MKSEPYHHRVKSCGTEFAITAIAIEITGVSCGMHLCKYKGMIENDGRRG